MNDEGIKWCQQDRQCEVCGHWKSFHLITNPFFYQVHCRCSEGIGKTKAEAMRGLERSQNQAKNQLIDLIEELRNREPVEGDK